MGALRSFDQAQPPTPQRTPTSPAFDNSFQTPKFGSSFYDPRVDWNTADPNSESPNLLRTPRPVSFETPRQNKSIGRFEPAQLNQENHPPGANAQAGPTTPNAQRALHQSAAFGLTPNFGSDSQGVNQSPQPGLTLDTSASFRSAGSIQTPPPTTTSAAKRKGKKKQVAAAAQPAKSADTRRMSAPLAPRPDKNGAHAAQVEQSPQHMNPFDFSPDVLGYNFAAPATAPAYPQHKLFWDSTGGNGADMDFGQDMGDPFDPSLSTILDPFGQTSNQHFLAQAANPGSFLDFNDDATPVASFVQSDMNHGQPQPQNLSNNFAQSYNGVDPSLLFSSPSKLSEPLDVPASLSRHLTEESLQPYAYQVQEAKREKSYGGVAKHKKRRKPSVDSPAVRAALETLREDNDTRPSLRRSMTDSIVPPASRGSSSSRPGSIHGRSSPLKRNRDSIRRLKSRPSVSLAVDENGRARLVEALEKGSGEDGMDLDSQSDSSSTEESENENEMMAGSFAQRSSIPKLGRFSSSASHSQKSSNTSLYSDGQSAVPEVKQRPSTSGAPSNHPRLFNGKPLKPLREATSMEEEAVSEAETIMDSDDGELNAQSELRKVMRSREPSRSSRPRHHVYSPHSKQNAHFANQNDLFLSNISPTTLTDPDLATPSSGTSSTSDSIRCLCNAARIEGQMIQW
ncbi:MAG: hypothetical protein MMC23_004124 [Stictis urceolatum]|nr:hypothetical protein [Stictis urceolata]